jgi:hypothetical protein
MDLLQYLQSSRRGKDARNLERESMNDPFLADAISGYASVDGNHIKTIKKLQKEIGSQSGRAGFSFWKLLLALLAIALIAALCYFVWYLIDNHKFTNNSGKTPEKKTYTIQPSVPAGSEAFPDSEIIDENESPVEELHPNTAAISVLDSLALKAQADSIAQARAKQKYLDEKKAKLAQNRNYGEDYDSSYYYEQPENSATSQDEEFSARKEQIASSIVENSANATPAPVGGMGNYRQYLDNNVRAALVNGKLCSGKRGMVVLLFSVNDGGRPVDVSILRSLCPEADSQAIRMLTSGPGWTKGTGEVRLEIPFYD